jgi:hypothetical protein
LSSLRFLGVLIVPTTIAWWYYLKRYNPVEMPDLVIVTLLLSLIFTPFAWSFDAIVLILPLIRLAAWAVEGRIDRLAAVALLIMFIAVNAIAFYQRSIQVWDWSFFWFPAAIAGLYFVGLWQRKRTVYERAP